MLDSRVTGNGVYEWAVFLFGVGDSPDITDAKHLGITDSVDKARSHVESALESDSECAVGVMRPVTMVQSATRALSFEWVQAGKPDICVRNLDSGVRWLGSRLPLCR